MLPSSPCRSDWYGPGGNKALRHQHRLRWWPTPGTASRLSVVPRALAITTAVGGSAELQLSRTHRSTSPSLAFLHHTPVHHSGAHPPTLALGCQAGLWLSSTHPGCRALGGPVPPLFGITPPPIPWMWGQLLKKTKPDSSSPRSH